jgi:hypothetical protein
MAMTQRIAATLSAATYVAAVLVLGKTIGAEHGAGNGRAAISALAGWTVVIVGLESVRTILAARRYLASAAFT